LSFTAPLHGNVCEPFTFFPFMLVHGASRLAAALVDWLQVCI
jgi:hypothetical protein